jgi:hypothetical protein
MVQSASTKASGSAQKSSVISVACERRFSFLSTAPKSNNDDFDFTAGFLSTSSLKIRTRAPNDDPTSIEQIAAVMSAFGGKADIEI